MRVFVLVLGNGCDRRGGFVFWWFECHVCIRVYVCVMYTADEVCVMYAHDGVEVVMKEVLVFVNVYVYVHVLALMLSALGPCTTL